MVKTTARQNDISPGTFDPPSNHVEVFEIDRSNMVFQLRSLSRAVDEGAEEMKMVAAEKVFDNSLSRALDREALKLRSITRDLDRLLGLVERAQVAGATRRSSPRRKQPHRGNSRK